MRYSQWYSLLHRMRNLETQIGMTSGPRMGTVHEVKEGGGERKMRVVYGIRPDGSPLISPWLHGDDHSSPGEREQQLFVKGQNVTLNCQGNDIRQASVSPYSQSKCAPQPDFAGKKTNGRSHQRGDIGIRMHGPEEDQQGGGQGGGGGSGGGSSGGGGQGGQNKGHIYDTFIFKSQKPPPHQEQPNQPLFGGGGQQQATQQQQQGGQQQQDVKPDLISRHHQDDNSITDYVEKGKNRSHTTDKGAEISANDGKTYGTAFTDGVFQVVGKPPQVNMPWRIKTKQGLKKTDMKIA